MDRVTYPPNTLLGLPPELLQQILRSFLEDEEPFWLEHCTALPRHRLAAEDHDNVLINPPAVTRLTTAIAPSQAVHARDWVAINSACRRIRAMGKAEFFRSKRTVVFRSLPVRFNCGRSWLDLSPNDKLAAVVHSSARATLAVERLDYPRHTTDCGAPKMLPLRMSGRKTWPALTLEDQALAMSQIRHLIILDAFPFTPFSILRLPSVLTPFQAITSCALVMRYKDANYVLPLEIHMADESAAELTTGRDAADLATLLVRAGVDGNLLLGLGVCGTRPWIHTRRRLVSRIFPMLRFRARFLNRSWWGSGS